MKKRKLFRKKRRRYVRKQTDDFQAIHDELAYPANLKTNKHHRCPKSRGAGEYVRGKNGQEYHNIAVVPIQCHEAFNMLFGSATTPERVCAILNRYWIDPRKTIRFYLIDTE